MAGRVCVVTGASSGIGKETARELASLGATVVLACRDRDRGEAARLEIEEETQSPYLELMELDLARLSSVRRFARTLEERHRAVHALVNNAGIYSRRRIVTEDGFELTFQTNHLGHFLLTHLLLAALRRGAPSRIVNVASEAQRGGRIDFEDLMGERRWSGVRAYTQSKLANVMFTYELSRRLAGTGVTANAVHPGTVRTGWGRHEGGAVGVLVKLASPFMISAAQGARTSIHVACAPALAGATGRYFAKSRERRSSPRSYDVEAQRRLWEISESLVGLKREAAAR